MATVVDFPRTLQFSESGGYELPAPRVLLELIVNLLEDVPVDLDTAAGRSTYLAYQAARYGLTGDEFYRDRLRALIAGATRTLGGDA